MTVTPALARAEISRRANNKRPGVSYEKAAHPNLLTLTGAELKAVASKGAKPKAPRKKAAPKVDAVTLALRASRKAATAAATAYAEEHAPEGQFMRTMLRERTRLLSV